MHEPETIATSWNGLSELRPLVVGYLRRFLRDDAEIEDTAQETLIRAARFRLNLADPTRLRTWILRIALNVLRDRRRRERRLPRAEADDEFLLGIEGREEVPGETTDDAWIVLSGIPVERRAAIEHLDAAITSLDPDDRGLLVRGKVCASEVQADAVCEGPSVAASKHRIYRARRRLTRALIQRFAMDADLDWPSIDGVSMEPRSVGGALCARTRLGSWSEDGAQVRPGG